MISRYIAILVSFIGIVSAVVLATKMSQPVPPTPIFAEPAKNPYQSAISASGLIEAVRENVAIGAPASGVIQQIHADVCQMVQRGDPLFCLDCRELRAEERVKQARVSVSCAKLLRLQDQLDRLKSIQDPRAVSMNEVRTKENDVLVAESELEEARSELYFVQTKLENLTVRSPQDGIVLQRRVKEGEFVAQNGLPAFIIGDISELQIRADIDEQNASWLTEGTKAYAFPKNRPDKAIPLKFVRIDPFVIPKKSLTGLGDERVDTRVLQVIYTLEPPKDFKLYIGQQVDVFIENEA